MVGQGSVRRHREAAGHGRAGVRRSGVLGVLLAVLALMTAGTAVAADPAGLPDPCRPATLYAVPGTVAGSADVLRSITGPLAARTWTALSVVTVPPVAATPASEVGAVDLLAGLVRDHVAACPAGSVLLLGHSIGAQAVGDLASRVGAGRGPGIPAERVAAVGLLGDPARDPVTRVVPEGVRGLGVIAARPDGFGALAPRTIGICAPADPVCARAPGAPRDLDAALAVPAHVAYAALPVAPGVPLPTWAADSLTRVVTALATPASPPGPTGSPTPTPTPTPTTTPIPTGGATTAPADGPRVCEKFGSTPVAGGRYLVQNDEWGADDGQCVTATATGFRVDGGAHHRSDGPAAYPSIVAGCWMGTCTRGTALPARIAGLGPISSDLTATVPAGLRGALAYDLWADRTPRTDGPNDALELMIWLRRDGGVAPIGARTATVTIGGAAWEVWRGTHGGVPVVSYVRSEPVDRVRGLPITDFVADAVGRGAVDPGAYLTSVQAGVEPWTGGPGVAVTDFAVQGGGAERG